MPSRKAFGHPLGENRNCQYGSCVDKGGTHAILEGIEANMRNLGNKKPPLVGFVLKEPIRCPECNDELVADDTAVAIVSDVICDSCQLIVMEIVPWEQWQQQQ